MDMDSYFASVEQQLRPELRGKPVAVIPVETDFTCAIAASYEAKRRGVKTGTGVREARQLCPETVFVKARPATYVAMHHRILDSVNRCLPVEKVYSIDEWTFALRGPDRNPEVARSLALQIKQQLRQDIGEYLSSSIGIAPSRLLAKIGTKLQKPNGLTVLSLADLPHALEALSPGDLPGIGHGMQTRLQQHGITTIRQLWELSQAETVRLWGSISGARWWAGFHGLDEPEVPTRRQSMTHGNVLDPRFRNAAGAHGILVRLVCKLGQRLRAEGYLTRGLQLSILDIRGAATVDFVALPTINDTSALLAAFEDVWSRHDRRKFPPKKVDVCVTGLVPETQVAPSLFAEDRRAHRVSHVVDQINQRWGALSVYVGAMHEFRQPMDEKIAFGRIPTG